jgi:hypothetical protein
LRIQAPASDVRSRPTVMAPLQYAFRTPIGTPRTRIDMVPPTELLLFAGAALRLATEQRQAA